jgi:hypothetical protein
MRRTTILMATVALAGGLVAVFASSGAGMEGGPRRPSSASVGQNLRDSRVDVPSAAYGTRSTDRRSKLRQAIGDARVATARYASDLEQAKADGYQIITQMIPDMGFHFLNPAIKDFNVERPPILVYEKRGDNWQLGALEWVFPKKPAKPPLPGAKYGSFAAACHFVDGTFVVENDEQNCAERSPETGAAFNFWHPRLVTLHFWIWYPNPDGLFASMNPFVRPFNQG